MGRSFVTINGHTVLRDDDIDRWYDVWGDKCVKWELDMVTLAQDASANPAGYTTTEVGTNTIVLQESTDRGELLITCGGTENNGLQIQPLGEAFSLGTSYPCYFGCEFKINDVDQVDAFVGLAIADTTVLAGCSDDAGFRTDDESAALQFILEKGSAESTSSVATLADDTWVIVDFYYDGSNIYAYVDGSLKATVANTDTNFPDDEHLTPTIAILTGEATANTLTVRWARAFQVYG